MRQNNLLSRDNTLWMQGISAIMIMVMHFVMQIDGYPRAFNVLGSIGVAIFLFISGFGINESQKISGIRKYWTKRITRVAIPFWTVILMKLPFGGYSDPYSLLKSILFIESELWFIDFIMRWYIVYWIARYFFTRHTTIILAIFSVVCIIGLQLPDMYSPVRQLCTEQALSFFCGYLVSEKYDYIRSISRSKIFKTAALATSYGIILMIVKEIPAIQEIKGTMAFNILLLNIKLPLATAIIAVPYLFPAIKRIPLSWFGKISYEIYIVHYNFMPFITGITSILSYSAISVFISIIFHKLNTLLRQKFIIAFAAFLFIGICYMLMCKYSMRATDYNAAVCIAYTIVLAITFILISDRIPLLSGKHNKTIFWLSLMAMTIAMIITQYSFDPELNRVDRWSAIANPITALFNGEFPYSAETHLGGNASPFPAWMIFHIPFWALGNVGLSEIVTTVLFAISVKTLYGHEAGTKAILMLVLCVNLWYETAVRSDLISNFLLLAAFINFIISKRITFKSHPILLSAISGLWLSTRISTFFPLFIMFFPAWLSLTTGKKALTIATATAVLFITFIPLILWDASSLLFAENNPFSLQFRQGHSSDTVVFVIIAILMAVSWKNNTRRMMMYSAIILIIIPIFADIHNMIIRDNWTQLFVQYDITYLDAALPFLITLLISDNK